jgi:hypothetical protein
MLAGASDSDDRFRRFEAKSTGEKRGGEEGGGGGFIGAETWGEG